VLNEVAAMLPDRVSERRTAVRMMAGIWFKWSAIILVIYLGALPWFELPNKARLAWGGVLPVAGIGLAMMLHGAVNLHPRWQKYLLRIWRIFPHGISFGDGTGMDNHGFPRKQIRTFRLREVDTAARTAELTLENQRGRTFTLVFDAAHVDLAALREFLAQRAPAE
jgi:hypothetical protein